MDDNFIKIMTSQLLSDLAVMSKAQNHDFIALTSQNRSFSTRCGQQLEKNVVEFDYSKAMAKSMFDPSSSSFMLQKDRNNNDSILINETHLMNLLLKK